ncbi:MAG: SurA N-terminal domain-containing protein [Rhizobiaceae bacterium]|nr:SurA N-terminal domain-containing protein [Rhizobiaceae bacterium]
MLTLLRKSVGTWVAKVFILLLVLSFGVWGVSGAIVGGSSGTVIEVGSTKVSANDYVLAYERARFGLSQQFGRLLTREEARAFGIDANVVARLVSGAVLDESANNMGLGLSTKNLAALIGEDVAFQDASGNFDRRVLSQQLRQLGMSEEDYVKNRQAVAVRGQLLEGISANSAAPQAFLDAYDKYRNEKRQFEYVTLTPELLGISPTPTQDDIKKQYENNKAEYIAPEYRKIVVIKLEPEDISDPSAITRQEIADEYEARNTEFLEPEKRLIQQLALESEEQGKSILERISSGELFETILSELGKSQKDIELGEFANGTMPDANVGTAAFELELNEISDVVPGIFGPVLLRVTQITPESVKPLSDVEDELRSRLALVKAGDQLFDIHDQLENERAAGDSLSEAATKVRLKIRTIDSIDAQGRAPDGTPIDDLPDGANLVQLVFDTGQGVETDPISLNNNGFVWYEVQDIIQERQKKLEEVTDAVSEAWVKEETLRQVEKIAQDLEGKVSTGDNFTDAFSSVMPDITDQLKTEMSAELSREDTSDDLSVAAVRAGFAIPKDKTALAPGTKDGSQVVLKVVEIITSTANPISLEEKQQLDETIANDILNQLVADLQQRETLSINQTAIVAAQNLIR